MEWLDDLKMYARFGWGLRGYLQQRITLEEARSLLQRRLAERETAFLRLVERAIYGYPRSPYLPLLKLAQCELGDIQRMVRQKGLENTLRALRDAGVYVSFEEFKGRAPIERQGQVWPVKARDFDNPFLSHYFQSTSSGSTGAGTRVSIDLDHLRNWLPHAVLTYATHDLMGIPLGIWRGILPDDTGISIMLRTAPFGQLPRRWFTPFTHSDLRPALKYRLATRAFITLARLYGTPVPSPEPLAFDQAIVMARWAHAMNQEYGRSLIRAGVSLPVHISVAALEAGLDLTGTIFLGGGEPITPGKMRTIQQAGARQIPLYTTTDMGQIGIGCPRPQATDEVHFMQDHLALIQTPRRVPGTDIMVDAFNFTALAPSNPKKLFEKVKNEPDGGA